MIDEERLYRMVGSRLRNLRESQLGERGKLTQAELAVRVGLERTSITNIEKGEQKLPLHVLFRLCDALDAPVFEVLPMVHEVQSAKEESRLVEVRLNEGEVVRVPPSVQHFLESI